MLRLHRPGVGHPLPRRPLPGPVRARRKTYALLQTPEFVEEFILDRTLDPAIEEFGLEPARRRPRGPAAPPAVIDPACGSGHFLLGAFGRLLAAGKRTSPATDKWELIRRRSGLGPRRGQEPVRGRDRPLPPAAGRDAGRRRRRAWPSSVDFPLNIAVGDSLLHGKGAPATRASSTSAARASAHTYRTEDVEDFIKSVDILEVGTYHVVVGNPPYITVKDKAENENYRKAYDESAQASTRCRCRSRSGSSSSRSADGDAGWLRRPDHRELVHEARVRQEAHRGILRRDGRPDPRDRHSGAYIPGHGTPTVILFGRNVACPTEPSDPGRPRRPRRAEQPDDPANGLVWQAIVSQIDKPGSESRVGERRRPAARAVCDASVEPGGGARS